MNAQSAAMGVGRSSSGTSGPAAGGGGDVAVLVVDDQPHFRAAARAVIDAVAGFELAGEASSGEDGVRAVGKLCPSLVLLDVRMPGIDGIEAARRIKDEHPATVVVLVSADDIAAAPSTLVSCGASAFIRKQDFGGALLRRLWTVHGRS